MLCHFIELSLALDIVLTPITSIKPYSNLPKTFQKFKVKKALYVIALYHIDKLTWK